MRLFKNIKRILQNIAIFLTVLTGFGNIAESLPTRLRFIKQFRSYYHTYINPASIAMHGVLSLLIGFLMLVLAYRLFKRIYFAWIIELISLSISFILQILKSHSFARPIIILELLIIIILALSYKDFTRRSNKITIKWAFLLAGISIILVLLNAAVGLMLMKNQYHGIKYFGDAIIRSIKLLIFMDTSASEFTTKIGQIYADSLISLNWICIVFSVFMVLKPFVFNSISDIKDKERVRSLVLSYGQNTISYLAVENDKKYFFSNTVDGVVAYTLVSDVAVCCGDIICNAEDALLFLSEFITFCKQNVWDIVMLNVTDKFLPLYKAAGFGCVKYGEDAMFRLSEYNLAGGRVAKVRTAINHANKVGIKVCEYKPLEGRDIVIEKEIADVSRLWLKGKKNREMAFMLGGLALENPMDRRYFIARDTEGKMQGFIVFLPFQSGKAYLADVTRRMPDAPQGVLEKILYDAFMIMKDEGVEWVSLGLSPLANMHKDDHKVIVAKLFEFVYEHLNNMYGFKALHHAKEKYAPTEWQTRYMVYYPPIFSPRMAYSIVKAQNPNGISEFLFSQLKQQMKKSSNSHNMHLL